MMLEIPALGNLRWENQDCSADWVIWHLIKEKEEEEEEEAGGYKPLYKWLSGVSQCSGWSSEHREAVL